MVQKEKPGLKVEEKRKIFNIEGVVGKVLNNFYILTLEDLVKVVLKVRIC